MFKNNSSPVIYLFSKLFQYLFEVAFLTFVIFFFLEYFKEGLITNYFNFNWLLIFSLIFGIITLLLPYYPKSNPPKKRPFLFFLISVFVGIFIHLVLPETMAVYELIPWLAGAAVWISLLIMV
ncbi:MAG: hypothetical protein AAB653_01040 [Patescibacteria group bacterium]